MHCDGENDVNKHVSNASQSVLSTGANKSPLISVSKRLKALLPSGLEMKMPDEHLETLYKLLDLVSISSDLQCYCEKEIEALRLHLDAASVVTAAQLRLQKHFSVTVSSRNVNL